VGIICLLVKIGLIDFSKSGGGGVNCPSTPLPGSDRPVHIRSKGERTGRHAIKTRQAAQPLLHSKD